MEMEYLYLLNLMLISMILAHYTTVGQYEWFQDKYLTVSGWKQKLLGFKLFWCIPCQTFWLTLFSTALYNMGWIGVIASFTTYTIQKELIKYVQRNE